MAHQGHFYSEQRALPGITQRYPVISLIQNLLNPAVTQPVIGHRHLVDGGVMAQFQAVAAAVGFHLLDGGTQADQVDDGADVFRDQMQGTPTARLSIK